MRLISPASGFSNMREQWPLFGVVFQVRWFMRNTNLLTVREVSPEGACSLKYLMAVVSLEGAPSSNVYFNECGLSGNFECKSSLEGGLSKRFNKTGPSWRWCHKYYITSPYGDFSQG